MTRHRCFIHAVVFLVLGASLGMAQRSPYFPETGAAAVHQRALDLGSEAVVLQLALQPGDEDFALIAHLRLDVGARVVVAYVTNGEATAGDEGGSSPAIVAGERKEEAARAMALLGTTPYFLNLPDPGVVNSTDSLRRFWNRDTTVLRLARAIRVFRPDVVLVGGDLRGDTVRSLRQTALLEFTREAIRSAVLGLVGPDTLKGRPWDVPRLYVESSPESRAGANRAYDRMHRVWKKSSRTIGLEAAQGYRSRRLQMRWLAGRGDRRYSLVSSRGTGNPRSMLDGLPVQPPDLVSLGGTIRKIASREQGGLRAPFLPDVSRAIDSVDVTLARKGLSPSPESMRLLAGWKNGLEELRCSLLDVNVEFACSDSLVTVNQLIFLKFKGIRSKSSGKQTWILFPGAIDHTWGINESIENKFAFEPPCEFRVITPKQMEMAIPLSQLGITQTSLRTRFSFLVYHQDSLRERSFVYRGEVLLRVGPRRTYEILTPIVRALNGERVAFRMLNISRDPYEGNVSIADSLAEPVSKQVYLARKDFVLVDTVALTLRKPLPSGSYPVFLNLSGGEPEGFVVRSFDAAVDSTENVGLVSAIGGSTLAQGLDRLRIQWQRLDPQTGGADLSRFGALVVDRDAEVQLEEEKDGLEAVRKYVREGGHLVVLPQLSSRAMGSALVPGCTFRQSPQFAPETALLVDSADAFARTPNLLTASDWERWVVSRSFCSLNVPADRSVRRLVSAGRAGIPLVVEFQEGKGHITLVALDLESQLLNVHPGAHRILANILARK